MIPTEDLLGEIRRLADGESPPTLTEFDNRAKYGRSTVFRRFESWNAALRQAGYSSNKKHNVSAEDLLAEICRLADGESPPTVTEFNNRAKYSAKPVYRRFESWNAALRQAGYSPNREQDVSDEDLLAEICRLADGESPPTQREFNNRAKHGSKSIYRRFESWNAALRQAGYSPNREQDVSDEDLLAEIRRLADGESPPTRKEFNNAAEHSTSTVYHRFGSWNAALRQVGYFPNQEQNVSNEDLLAEICRLADGESPPTVTEFNNRAKYSADPVFRWFESWNAALRQAGYSPNREQDVSDEDLIKRLRADIPGTTATSKEHFDGQYPVSAYNNRFGWWQATVLAGLRPRERRPLASAQFAQFFKKAKSQQQPERELICLLEQFTGLTAQLISQLSGSWLMERPRGLFIEVPPKQTRSGDKWRFKIIESWSDDGIRRETGLSSLLTWYFDLYDSLCDSVKTVYHSILHVAADAGLSNREMITRSEVGTVPLVRPGDLRATGGVRMARNGAPARRIQRHLGIEHTGWQANVEDFFLWCAVHNEEFDHPDYDPSEAVLDPITSGSN